MAAARPVAVHVTSYRFAPDSHPGIFRCVTGLAGLGRHVVLYEAKRAYTDASLPAEVRRTLAERDLHVHAIPFSTLKWPWKLRHLLAGLRRRYGVPEAVLGHLGNNGWRSIPLAAQADIPVLAYLHGTDVTTDLHSERYGWRYRRLLEAPGARWLAVAVHLTRRLVAFGADASRCHTLHLGVDRPSDAELAALRAEGPPDGPLRVVLAGRLIPVKGHALALHAAARVAAGAPALPFRLAMFGSGPLEPELRALARSLGLEERVEFRGTVPSSALRAELARAALAIQPSVTTPAGVIEGVPNTVLEAMAAGLPVLATRHGGLPEAVADGETGLLADEGDVEGLAGALRRLLEDAELRRRLGSAGRARAAAEFDVAGQGRRLRARLDEAIASYRTIPAAERAAAWARARTGIVQDESALGRRTHLKHALLIQRNRVLGQIP